jgi:hypothetical protein
MYENIIVLLYCDVNCYILTGSLYKNLSLNVREWKTRFICQLTTVMKKFLNFFRSLNSFFVSKNLDNNEILDTNEIFDMGNII